MTAHTLNGSGPPVKPRANPSVEETPNAASPPDESQIYRDAVIDYRQCSPDQLWSLADVLTADLIDDDEDWPGPVGRYIAGERLRAVVGALQRWERLARLTTGLASPADRRYQRWRDLATLVRERVPIFEVFRAAGHELRPAGRNGRRGCPELHGACPACGGRDRLIVWDDGPHGRAWCRQCPWSGDHVGAAMALERLEFRDAVKWLAGVAGVAT